MDSSRRGNYDSGEDFVLEYGELRFTFNEADFAERCEQAAIKVGFVGGRLGEEELEDLVNLAVNGEISDPASALGQHVNDCWPELIGPAERSLVHWLRRLVFRGAWLDQRVNEGELSVAFDEQTGGFSYVQPVDPLTAARGEVEDRLATGRGQRDVERDHGALAPERTRRGRDQRQRASLTQVARRRERLACSVRRKPVEPIDQHDGVPTPRS